MGVGVELLGHKLANQSKGEVRQVGIHFNILQFIIIILPLACLIQLGLANNSNKYNLIVYNSINSSHSNILLQITTNIHINLHLFNFKLFS